MTLSVEAIGPEAAPEVVGLIHAAFGARPPLDPPSTALDETEATVTEALREHGGVITCDSTEGQGTVFTLALPLTQPAGRERILQA